MVTSAFSDSAQEGSPGNVVGVPAGEALAGQDFRTYAVPNVRFGRPKFKLKNLVPAEGFQPPTP